MTSAVEKARSRHAVCRADLYPNVGGAGLDVDEDAAAALLDR